MEHTPGVFLKARDLAASGEIFSIDGYWYRRNNFGNPDVVCMVVCADGTRKELHISSSVKRDIIIESSTPDMEFKLEAKPFTVNGRERTYFDLIQVNAVQEGCDDVPF